MITSGKEIDFNKRYAIGSGTTTLYTMDSWEEVTWQLAEMTAKDHLEAHFSTIYDRNLHRITDGCQWAWKFKFDHINPENADIWHEWN